MSLQFIPGASSAGVDTLYGHNVLLQHMWMLHVSWLMIPFQSSNASKFRHKSGARDGERSPRKVGRYSYSEPVESSVLFLLHYAHSTLGPVNMGKSVI